MHYAARFPGNKGFLSCKIRSHCPVLGILATREFDLRYDRFVSCRIETVFYLLLDEYALKLEGSARLL